MYQVKRIAKNRIPAAGTAVFVKHPDVTDHEISATGFALEIELENEISLIIHITADNRYEWFIDGDYIGMGPDRCDEKHWSAASYSLKLGKGKHLISAMVYFAWNQAPHAQLSMGPGFFFEAAETEFQKLFNTGAAPWKVRKYRGFLLENGWGAGHPSLFDCAKWAKPGPYVTPVTAGERVWMNQYGEKFGKWQLFPSNLPEQMREPWTKTIRHRAVLDQVAEDHVFRIVQENPDVLFQDFLDGKQPSFTIPPETGKAFVLDFEEYLCAYNVLTVSGGTGAEISVFWYESAKTEADEAKGNRNGIAGKIFAGSEQRDRFLNLPGPEMRLSGPWWRAGRYVILKIRTAKEALVLKKIVFEESRYPLEEESCIDFGNGELEKIRKIMVRALQCCAHETYIDCPFYEQLMYVGDTRLETLATAAITRDKRLPKRALDLFAWSRALWDGLVSERYPSHVPQLSATFTMIYPLIARDLMMMSELPPEDEFRKMRGIIRSIILKLEGYVNAEGLLENLPGWSFVDWPAPWISFGVPPPGESNAACSIFSLHYLTALAAARELEACFPEEGNHFDSCLQVFFERTKNAVKKIFWCPEKSLFADDREKTSFSTHAQALALIAGVLDLAEAERCIYAVRDSTAIVRPTVSFIFYWFEALKKYGFADWIYNELSTWQKMVENGAVTTWERQEPTRSDCHGWGAHLLYHFYATFAGIRSAAPGFKRVNVTPSFGPLSRISGRMVHPEGFIEFDLNKGKDGKVTGKIILPGSVSGKFACGGHGKLLNPGMNLL